MRLFCQHVCGSVRVFRQPGVSKAALIRSHFHLLAYRHTGRVQPSPARHVCNKNSVWRGSSVRFHTISLPSLHTRLKLNSDPALGSTLELVLCSAAPSLTSLLLSCFSKLTLLRWFLTMKLALLSNEMSSHLCAGIQAEGGPAGREAAPCLQHAHGDPLGYRQPEEVGDPQSEGPSFSHPD